MSLAARPSPNASKIAFASHRDGNWEIYVMDGDGGHQLRLTTRATGSIPPPGSRPTE
jgi:Tol biopolymer transport system component